MPSAEPTPVTGNAIRIEARSAWTIALLLALWPGITLATEIYRCEQDGVIVFADQPCDDNAEPHVSTGNVSVIQADGDLARIAEVNREFVEQRKERIAERRRVAAERARQRQQQLERAARQAERAAARQRTYPVRAGELRAARQAAREAIDQRRRDQADAPRSATNIGRAAVLPRGRDEDPDG